MSIRHEEQSLRKHLDMTLEGIDGFRQAVFERIKSGDWEEEHIEEINKLSLELILHEAELFRIKHLTW